MRITFKFNPAFNPSLFNLSDWISLQTNGWTVDDIENPTEAYKSFDSLIAGLEDWEAATNKDFNTDGSIEAGSPYNFYLNEDN